ncbi:DNA ligase (ATP) [Yamadazyma tenuis]|nr:DNA ligase (ATP) [Yamadazyma tenuis]
MYNIPNESNHTKLLREWKTQFHHLQLQNSDPNLSHLPRKICQVIGNRRSLQHKITKKYSVNQINEVLDQLSNATKTEDRIKILRPVFDNLQIDEIRWLLNIILKISNAGYMERFVFELWNENCYGLYTVCHDLSKAFRYFSVHDSIDQKQLIPHVNFPFIPQASQKLTASYTKLCSEMSEFYIEEKIDGDRMVLHYNNNKFKFFSRRCRDYSLLFGENFEVGSLTKHLKNVFHPKVTKLILDCEIVAFDADRKCILPFGTLRKAAIQEAVKEFTTTDMFSEHGCWPYLLVFDILQVNDTSLVNAPLYQRKLALEKAIIEVPNRLEILKYKLCKDPIDIENAVKGVIVDRSEGIMVKNTMSKYHVAKRDNSWIKVKPEYLESFGENLDLVVIGVLPGIKNSYMCGLYDTETHMWRSFCTVANGFTNEEFAELDRLMKDKLSRVCPENVMFGRRKPQYYLNPEESVVLEIKARVYDQRTDETYATNTTLRNLYCRGIRHDKSWDDCISYQSYEEQRSDRTKDIYETQDVNKRRRVKEESFTETTFRENMKANMELFKDYRFVVLSDKLDQVENMRISLESLKNLIKKFGGEIITSPSYSKSKPCLVISEKLTPRCRAYVELGLDIVHPNWLFYCIEYGKIIPMECLTVFESKNKVPENFDEYGDSFAVTPRMNLKDYLLSLKIEKSPSHQIINDLSGELESYRLLKDILAGSKFLIISNGIQCTKTILATKIQQFGGTVVEKLPCEYIIVPRSLYKKSRKAMLSEVRRLSQQISNTYTKGTRIPNIVIESFIDSTIESSVKVDPQDHKVL